MPAVTTSFIAAILDAGLRAIFFALVMSMGLTMFRVTSVTARLWAWTIVLAAALLMPLVGRTVPALRWTLRVSAGIERFLPVSTFETPGSSPANDGRGGSPASRAGSSESGQVAGRAAGAGDPSSSRAGLREDWLALGLLLYFCGAIALLTRAVRGWHATRMLERHAIAITDRSVVSRLHTHAARLGLTHAPVLSESAALRVPVTVSVTQPRILLPSSWRAWSVERLDAVLVHELSHVARRDTLTQRLSLFYRAVAWFSPLAWWLHHHVADLAEQASDEAALASGADRTEYAETLLGFFAELQRTPQGAACHVAMARGAVVKAERRLDRILEWKGGQPMRLTRRLALGLVLAAAPLAALTASVRLVAAVPPPALAPSMTATAPSASPTPASRALGAAQVAAPSVKSPRTKPAPKVSSEQVIPVAPTIYQTADDDFKKDAYPVNTPDLVAPKPITHPEPKYTADAMRAKLEGVVLIEEVIDADGTVIRARVVQSLDKTYGLDEEALKAAKLWLFEPGTLNGAKVPVLARINLDFRLH